jgi:hypothetical protein
MNALVINPLRSRCMRKPLTPEEAAKLADQLDADPRPLGVFGLPNPLTPEEADKLAQQQVDALLREDSLQKLRTQQQVDALLRGPGLDMDRTKGLNVDRTKIADDGSREED